MQTNKKTKNKNTGFIALTSMLILSAVIVLLTLSTNTTTLWSRFDTLNTENKKISESLAEACVNAALLKLAENYSYDPSTDPNYQSNTGVLVPVVSNSCYIISITPAPPRSGNSSTVTITTKGVYRNSLSTYRIITKIINPTNAIPPTTQNISIISWEEI